MEAKVRTVAAKIWYTVESEKPNLTTIENAVKKARKGSVTEMSLNILRQKKIRGVGVNVKLETGHMDTKDRTEGIQHVQQGFMRFGLH